MMIKNLKILTFFGLFSILLASCTDPMSLEDDKIIKPHLHTGNINFENLQVGQRSAFMFFLGFNYKNPNDAFYCYTLDTLFMEIVDKDQDGFLIREYYSPNSRVFSPNLSRFNPSSVGYMPVEYRINIDNETVIFSQSHYLHRNSYLFGELKDASLPLREFAGLRFSSTDWTLGSQNLTTADVYGFVTDFELMGVRYDRLNVRSLYSKQGYSYSTRIHAYDPEIGVVRTMNVDGYSGTCFGWDLLTYPDQHQEIEYIALDDLVNTKWKLTHFESPNLEKIKFTKSTETDLTIDFQSDNIFVAFLECVELIANYNIQDDNLNIDTMLTAIDIECQIGRDLVQSIVMTYKFEGNSDFLIIHTNDFAARKLYLKRIKN